MSKFIVICAFVNKIMLIKFINSNSEHTIVPSRCILFFKYQNVNSELVIAKNSILKRKLRKTIRYPLSQYTIYINQKLLRDFFFLNKTL